MMNYVCKMFENVEISMVLCYNIYIRKASSCGN